MYCHKNDNKYIQIQSRKMNADTVIQSIVSSRWIQRALTTLTDAVPTTGVNCFSVLPQGKIWLFAPVQAKDFFENMKIVGD